MFSILVFLAGLALQTLAQNGSVPDQALVIDQKSFNVLSPVPPPPQANVTTVSVGTADATLADEHRSSYLLASLWTKPWPSPSMSMTTHFTTL